MLNDLSVYKNTKRNEPCPCGSGKNFKKYCMNAYKEAKAQRRNAKVSPFTPLQPLSANDKKRFTALYEKILFFSHQFRNNSDTIFVDDTNESVISFLNKERDYFYKNHHSIMKKYSQRVLQA